MGSKVRISKLYAGLLPIALLLMAAGCTLPPTPSAEPRPTISAETAAIPTAAPTAASDVTEAPTSTAVQAGQTTVTPVPTPTLLPTATDLPTPTIVATATEVIEIEEIGPRAKETIRFFNSQWETFWPHNAVALYIVEIGYEYPVEEVFAAVDSMHSLLPVGEIHVNLELHRAFSPDWYEENVGRTGAVLDLAGYTPPDVTLPAGSRGQTIEFFGQGFYVPSYMIEGDPERGIEATAPDLSSVFDLPRYKHLFADPHDPRRGVLTSCIIGWTCQKVIRAKWHGYGLYDDFNVVEPGGSAALAAAVTVAYEAGEPFLSYYWEPTDVVTLRRLTLLEEPEWTPECQSALDAAVLEEPYESEVGCGFLNSDVHAGVYHGLAERAPEVVEFLANMHMGSVSLVELEKWKAETGAEWVDVAVKYLKENREVWTKWITDNNADEIIARVDAALARE